MRASARLAPRTAPCRRRWTSCPSLCGRAAEKAGLIELTGELIERAQATGAMRADFSVDDIPSMMCGLARATAPRETAPPPMSWERYLEIIIAGLRAPGAPRAAPARRPTR